MKPWLVLLLFILPAESLQDLSSACEGFLRTATAAVGPKEPGTGLGHLRDPIRHLSCLEAEVPRAWGREEPAQPPHPLAAWPPHPQRERAVGLADTPPQAAVVPAHPSSLPALLTVPEPFSWFRHCTKRDALRKATLPGYILFGEEARFLDLGYSFTFSRAYDRFD